MPSLTESLTICLSVLAPWRCPSSTGSPRASAQRAFPSMMIAIFIGCENPGWQGSRGEGVLCTPNPDDAASRWFAGASDFEDLLFLVLQELVDLVHALVGEL